MKRYLASLLICLLLLPLGTRTVNADMGPKPSVNITFLNAPESCHVTLLSNKEIYGPWSRVGRDDVAGMAIEKESDEAYKAFAEYEDSDGFFFVGYLSAAEDDTFAWTYYPPEVFKVAVYDDATKQIKVSKIIEKEAFDSFYEADLEGDVIQVRQISKAFDHVLMFAARVIITLIVELLLGLLFGYRKKKEIRTIVITNLITQVMLNGILSFASYHSGYLVWIFFLPLLEIVVTVIELIVYLRKFKDHSRLKTVIYALLANGATFLLGMYGEMLFQLVV